MTVTVQVRHSSLVTDELVSTRPQKDVEGSGFLATSLSYCFYNCGSSLPHQELSRASYHLWLPG